jgi:hypothetical protein
VKLDVRRAAGADLDQRRGAAAQRRPECVAQLNRVARAPVAEAVQRRRVLEVEPVRGRDVLLVDVAQDRDRKEVEDAAAVVVERDDRQLEPEPGRGDQAADVVQKRDVADQGDDRPAFAGPRIGGDAECRLDRAVDPVGAAV